MQVQQTTKEKQTKKQLFLEIARFLLVGGTATVIDYLIFWLFDVLIFPAVLPNTWGWQTFALTLSVAFGFVCGLLINWVLSVVFVFQDTTAHVSVHSKKQFIRFALIGLVGLGLNELFMLLLVWLLPSITIFGVTAFLGMAWKKWLAKCLVTLLVLTWNYYGRKKFIFKT